MFFIFPEIFLVVGLALGGGLFLVSYKTRSHLKIIEDAKPCKAGSPLNGMVKIEGIAKAVNEKDLLTSPIEQHPCVYYRLVIEQFQSNAGIRIGGGPSRSNTVGGGSWIPIVEDVQGIPMALTDETGAVVIDPKEAKLDLQAKRRHANLFSKLPKELEQSLRERYKIVTNTFFLPKQMRYTETVIAQDANVFLLGECEVKNGKATFTKQNHPLMLSFRSEKALLRNANIVTKITGVAAVVVPIAFIVLAVVSYWNISSTFGPKAPNAPAAKQNVAKDDPSKQIAKLKSPNLSERAWAARKLGETAPVANLVKDAAPLLNPLLESKDVFHRDSALSAIKNGWGSKANEATLRRLLSDTKDAKVQKEINSALNQL
jgi:hypothetical protein